MAQYADYEYYTDCFFGAAIAEPDFPGLAFRASALVDSYTSGQAGTARGEDLAAVKNAVCALAEVLQDETRLTASAFSSGRAEQVQSETVGGWSRNYGSASATGTDLEFLEKRRRDAVLMYLGNTGMLRATGYRGCSM